MNARWQACWIAVAIVAGMAVVACAHESASGVAAAEAAPNAAGAASTTGALPVIPQNEKAPPATQTSGFDGQKAYDYTAKQVSFGPRPPASDAIRQTQDYLVSQLKGFGCQVDTDDFHAPTPIGNLAMKNIVAKIPGSGQGIILLMTHYDTLRLPGFVGADDAGSSTGVMLEIARLLCGAKTKQPNSVWIAFVDGEEDQADFTSVQQAQNTWDTNDTLFGSRELAARMDLSDDLKRTRAVILADMVGQKDLQIPPEASSTKWLVSLVWGTARRLGYGSVFVPQEVGEITDDHDPFLQHHVPSVDIIELGGYMPGSSMPYWHTPQDTMDKLSPKSLAISGHVIIESVSELQKKFH
ncbi:MAG: M28 family peptidase [Candidatus Acidiferrales bacterium]